MPVHSRPIVVTGARDNTVRVWDVEHGTLLRTLIGHTGSVRCLDTWANLCVSGSYDCSVRVSSTFHI